MKKQNRVLLPLLYLLLLSILALIVFTSAYMFRKTQVTNHFTPASVMCEVDETFNATSGVKSSIRIKNTGNIDSYLRVRLVSYWVDASGNIVGKPSSMPTISYDTEEWIYDSANETYYYKLPVEPSDETPELLTAPVTLLTDTFTGIGLPVEVKQVLVLVPEAFQARPTSAVADNWGVTLSNETITGIAA